MNPMTLRNKMNQAFNKLDAKQVLANDPVQVVRAFAERPNVTVADIEICAIWTAMVSFGSLEHTISAANALLDLSNGQPADYVKTGEFYDIPDDMKILKTIKGKQFKAVNHNLRATYNKVACVVDYSRTFKQDINELIVDLAESMEPGRLGSPSRNSSCKRINQLLRWMIRKDDIDLGIWQTPYARPSDLYAILSSEVAEKATSLGLISYPKDSWRAVIELTNEYKKWDRNDPLKFDFVFNNA